MEGTTCEIVNLRSIAVGRMPELEIAEAEEAATNDATSAVVDERRAREGSGKG